MKFNKKPSLFALVCLLLSCAVNSQTPELFEQSYAAYKGLCDKYSPPSVDCACMAKRAATWSHLSPNKAYADYLLESYKAQRNMVNNADEALKIYAAGRNQQEIQIEMYNAFAEYESASPNQDDFLKGCVIPDAPMPVIEPVTSTAKSPYYVELYNKRVSSTGHKRREACIVNAYADILTREEFEVLHRRIDFDDDVVAAKVGVAKSMVARIDEQARSKVQTYKEENGISLIGRCDMLLAPELSDGTMNSSYFGEALDRAGAPIDLAGIDVSKPRPKTQDAFGLSMNQASNEAETIKAESKQAKERFDNSMQEGKRIAQQDTDEVLSKERVQQACLKSGYSDTHCQCFTTAFFEQILPTMDSAAATLVILGMYSQGFSQAELIGLSKSADNAQIDPLKMMSAMQIQGQCN